MSTARGEAPPPGEARRGAPDRHPATAGDTALRVGPETSSLDAGGRDGIDLTASPRRRDGSTAEADDASPAAEPGEPTSSGAGRPPEGAALGGGRGGTRPSTGRAATAEPPEVVRLRSRGHYRVFERIMARQMARAFHAVRLAGPGVPDLPIDRPLVVVSNHPSWWDPPFAMRLVREIGRESYGPIEAAQLERYRFMRRLGLWGVEPGRRGAAAFLRIGEAVLADPGRMVWITGQGTFADPRSRPLGLRPGAARLLSRVPGAVALPVALEYPFWTESRPEALARIGAPIKGPATAARWQDRLEEGLTDAMDRLARDAQSRDPAAFVDLARGRSGVGGAYDLWRRASAAWRGERFEAGHMPEGR